jgi:hypothetical protein
MKKKILVLVFSNLKHDARVRRQVNSLKDRYDLTLACFDADPDANFKLITFKPASLTFFKKALISVFLLLRIYPVAWSLLHGHRALAKKLFVEKFDLIVANDVETLPLAFSIADKSKVLFDAHEYAPRHFEDKRMWRFFFQDFNIWLCEKYIPKVNGMITVGKALASEYEKNFHIKATVITNANNYFEINPAPVSNDSIRLIHHGIANRSRNLELMVRLMELLDKRFTLDLMLLIPGSASADSARYFEEFKIMASRNPKIKFLPAVKSTEVVTKINDYDIGVFLLPPINFNYENTLPNKLFDFIQARLGIAIGPTPEMAEIVNQYKNGVVSNDFTAESLAEKLNHLTKEVIETFKTKSGIAAKDLNAEKNAAILNSIVAEILNS